MVKIAILAAPQPGAPWVWDGKSHTGSRRRAAAVPLRPDTSSPLLRPALGGSRTTAPVRPAPSRSFPPDHPSAVIPVRLNPGGPRDRYRPQRCRCQLEFPSGGRRRKAGTTAGVKWGCQQWPQALPGQVLMAAALVTRIWRNTVVLAEAAPCAGAVTRGPACVGTLGEHSPQH